MAENGGGGMRLGMPLGSNPTGHRTGPGGEEDLLFPRQNRLEVCGFAAGLGGLQQRLGAGREQVSQDNPPGMPPSSWKGSSSQIKGWSRTAFLRGRATPSLGLETRPREGISPKTHREGAWMGNGG